MTTQAVSRTNIPFVVDIVTLRTPEAITKALATGDLYRFSAVTTPSELPWLLRWYFPASRFLSTAHGFFMPFRATDDPTYAPCRQYLDNVFKPPSAGISDFVTHAADLLGRKDVTDDQLSGIFARAIASRFSRTQQIPNEILSDSTKQIELGESFLPWKYIPAKSAMTRIYSFFQKALLTIKVLPGLPKPLVTDVAHSTMATTRHGPAILRAIGENPDENIDTLLARLGRVEQAPRMVTRESNLGGLLDKVAKPGWTVIMLHVRSAAQSTGDVAWAFGTGTTERRCAAEPAIKEFLEAVATEIQRRRGM